MERKEAIEVVKSNLPDDGFAMLREALETLIPELGVSEDESVRKWIIEDIRYNMHEEPLNNTEYKRKAEKAIAWLEMQGENIPSKETVLNVWDLGNIWKEITGGASNTEHGTQLDYIIRHWKEGEHYIKQGEQESVDKAVPKFETTFNVGNWIVANDGIYTNNGTNTFLITNINHGYGSLGDAGIICRYGSLEDPEGVVHYPCLLSANFFHPWTIEDAVDGDVLVDEDNNIGIYKEKDDLNWSSYIYLGRDNRLRGFSMGGYHNYKNTKPAAKKQCDLLFSKMKNAGYEWDAEKKELKQVKQEADGWKEGDVIKYGDSSIVCALVIKGRMAVKSNGEVFTIQYPDEWVKVGLDEKERFLNKLERQCGRLKLERGKKPADKAGELKFKPGDWVIGRATENEPRQIAEVTKDGYKTTYGGWIGSSFENDMHLWAVQDAKDGDVLINRNDEVPFIFKGFLDQGHPDCPVAYCGIDDSGEFRLSSGDYFWEDSNVKPATKEQRDFLFSKMREAGYEWDAVSKLLNRLL